MEDAAHSKPGVPLPSERNSFPFSNIQFRCSLLFIYRNDSGKKTEKQHRRFFHSRILYVNKIHLLKQGNTNIANNMP
jgi:hypothetical protein